MVLSFCRQLQLLFKMYKFINTVLLSCPEDSVSVHSSLPSGSYSLYTLLPSGLVPELWGRSDTDVLLTEEHATTPVLCTVTSVSIHINYCPPHRETSVMRSESWTTAWVREICLEDSLTLCSFSRIVAVVFLGSGSSTPKVSWPDLQNQKFIFSYVSSFKSIQKWVSYPLQYTCY